jgi:hypothetical protein
MSNKTLPFDCTVMDSEPVTVTNPFSGDSCELTPEAVAVYDVVIGANLIGDYKTVRKGIDWFRKHYAREYMILLD